MLHSPSLFPRARTLRGNSRALYVSYRLIYSCKILESIRYDNHQPDLSIVFLGSFVDFVRTSRFERKIRSATRSGRKFI